ncbi:MAG: ribonuclease P protein component [Ilumatobacter sp.]|nr:ribonuclease P protein component [Ilumatobacter sp.]
MIAGIRDRDAFVRLRRDGVRLRSDPLWCSYLADADVTPPQVGFALTRSIGSAVTRNRLRRQLKAILAGLDVPPGLLLVGATPRVVELTFDQLRHRTEVLVDAARSRARSAAP